MQIRARLTFRFIAIAAGILAAVLLYVYRAYQQDLERAFYEGLESKTAFAIRTTLREGDQLAPLPPVASELDDDILPYRNNVSIFNDAYQCVFSLHPDAEPIGAKTLQTAQNEGEIRFRHRNLHGLAVSAATPSGRPFVVVAEDFCDMSGLEKLRNILIVSFLLGITAVAAGGWYFAGQALRPVSQIVNQVDGISPTDLSRRLEIGQNRDEIGRLAETFNRLLDRVEHAFRMQRQFLSNVSHELKNPLTVIQTQLDVALQRERTPAEYRATLASVLDDVTAVSEVEEKLLQLARVHSDATNIPMTAVRLDEMLWQAREQALKKQPGGKVSIEFDEMPADESLLDVRANEPLLRTAFANIIENGVKYAPDRRAAVRVRFSPDGAHTVEIADNGPGIPPEERALVLEPFYRSPRHLGIKGTGIGLSLTHSILHLHGIGLEISTQAGGGTVFRVRFSPPGQV